MSKKKVVVCMPVHSGVEGETTQRLIDLLAHKSIIGRIQVNGSLIHKARNKLLDLAIERFGDATHLLFVDSDMTFDNDVFQKLLDSDKSVIGALSVEKQVPFHPCVVPLDEDWKNLKPIIESEGVERVDSIGMGFTLIEMDLIKKAKKVAKFPFFFEKDTELGEDYNFCRVLRGLGESIHVHCGARVGHLAYLPVGIEHFKYNLANNPATDKLRESIFAQDKVQDSKDK
mgnify:CR=1 FL=1